VGISLLCVGVVARWDQSRRHAVVIHAGALLALMTFVALVPEALATAALLVASALFLVVCLGERLLTPGAAVLAWLVTALVTFGYPASWVVALAFLLGWTSFGRTLRQPKTAAAGDRSRDTTDLLPLAAIVVSGAAFVGSSPLLTCVAVFGAVSFVVNDALSSDIGPLLPGQPRLLPRLQAVPHETPGAISVGGTALGIAGSICAGLCAASLVDRPRVGFTVVLAGSMAALADSALSRLVPGARPIRVREMVNAAACLVAISLSLFLAHP
jgi:uncharacterized membrane protein